MISLYKIRSKSKLKDLLHTLQKLFYILLAKQFPERYTDGKGRQDTTEEAMPERRCGVKKKLQSRFSTRQYMLSEDYEIYYYKDHYCTVLLIFN